MIRRAAPLPLLACAALFGCGGGSNPGTAGDGDVPAGFYGIDAQLLRGNTSARAYTGRASVAADGTVRVFALDPSNSRLSIVRIAGQTNTNGTNANARLDGLTSTGDLSLGGSNLVTFGGTGFTFTANGVTTALPTLVSGTTITAGSYRGELFQLGPNGTVLDWGTVSAILNVTTPNGSAPVNTLTANLISTAGTDGRIEARLLANGTATGTSASAANWGSDGVNLTLRLTGNTYGSGFFLVLDRRTP